MSIDLPPDLRDHYLAGRLIVFVGAGVSASFSWTEGGVEKRAPTWSAVVDEAARQLDFEDPGLLRVRGTDLQILEYFGLVKGGMDPLVNWILEQLRPPDDALRSSPVHSALAGLDKCHLVYTTNYDDFIERALELHGKHVVGLSREHDFPEAIKAGLHTRPIEVVKFHGDLNERGTMVLTESHYQERLELRHEMDFRLRSDLLGRAVLFVGYSFRDPNVSYIFNFVNRVFNTLPDSQYGRRAFIASPDPSSFERRLFRSRNIDVIPIRAEAESEDTAALLHRLTL